MRLSLLVVPVYGAIFCFVAAMIMHIKSQRSLPKRQKPDRERRQFLEAHLKSYGTPFTVKTYFALGLLGYTGMMLALYLFVKSAGIAFGLGVIGLVLPELALRLQSERKRKQFENRYAQALQQMAASLRSGLTIQQSVSDICKSPFIHNTIKESFRQIDADLTVGLGVKEAFMRAADTLQSEDAMDVALSLTLQNTLGGSEAKVVETVARNISSRILLRREIKSLFADTNITIWTMDVMPLLIIAGLFAGSPQYIETFFQTPTMTAVFAGILAFTMVGSVVIRKVVRRGTGGL